MSFRRHFFADRQGSISVAFALSIAVFITGIGVALDYARISSSQTSLQSALDSAILSAGKGALATGEAVDKARMIAEIKANLPEHLQQMADSVEITQTAESLSARLSGTLDNRFGFVLGAERSTVAVAASVPLGAIGGGRHELALVLDTTGSMAQNGKMEAMKEAVGELLDLLTANLSGGSELAIGVVPFTDQVRIDNSNSSQPWFRRSSNVAFHFNPGQALPGKGSIALPLWDGCITDRDKPLNRSRAVPNPDRDGEKYPASYCTYAPERILPLTTDIRQVRARIASLIAQGSTNTTIGMAWGLNILNPSAPLGGGAAPAGSSKPTRVLVFMTDGINNQDRFKQTPLEMDADMRELCREAKSTDVRIFTVRFVQGNDALLRDCASDPADFYTTDSAAGIAPIFRSIGKKLTKLRLGS